MKNKKTWGPVFVSDAESLRMKWCLVNATKPTKREVYVLDGIEVSREVANNAVYAHWETCRYKSLMFIISLRDCGTFENPSVFGEHELYRKLVAV